MDAKGLVPSASAPPVATAPREKELFEITVDGREAASVREVCVAWKQELMSAVRRMQQAGQGLDGYDEKSATCTEVAAPRLEGGALPDGWSIPTAVTLAFFDGVAMKEDRYLMLRRKDGRIVGGPEYSSANDIGDSGRPSGWRLALTRSQGTAVLLLASVTLEIPRGAWRQDGTPDPSADWIAEHRGRLCRFEAMRVKCDEERMTVFAKRTLTAAQKANRGSTLSAELPVLMPTGRMRSAED